MRGPTTLRAGMNRTASTAPPIAPRQPRDVSVHGDPRNDDYFWLRDRDDPRTLAYLKAENAYADAWLAPHAELKETLYQEMLSRIQQDDDSVPMRKGDWWYSTQTRRGEQYPHYLRRRAVGPDRRYDPSGVDETLLDLNELARDQPFLRLGLTAVTRDATRLAYTTDLHRRPRLHAARQGPGDRRGRSRGRSRRSRRRRGRTTAARLYYVTMDETKRANRLWRHVVGSGGADELLHEEADELFDIGVGKTLDERYLLLGSESKDSTEWQRRRRRRGADRPFALRTVFARRADVEYDLEHRAGRFYVRINDTGRNFRLVTVDAEAPDLAPAEELIARARPRHARRRRRLRRPPRRHRARRRQPAAARHRPRLGRRPRDRLRRAGVQRPHQRQRRVRDDDAALRLHLDDDAGVDLRLRPGDARAGAEEAPAGAGLRPVAVRERAHLRRRRRRHRGADLARLSQGRPARRAAAAAPLRLRQLRHPDRRRVLAVARLAARPRRRLRDRPHPRRRRPRPQLVRGRQDGEEADHLRRLHRLRGEADRRRPDDAGACWPSRAAAPAAC